VQDITGVVYALDAVRLRGAGPRSDGCDEQEAVVATAAHRLRGCVRSLRTLLVDLYPPNLIAEGLGPALADLAASTGRKGPAVLHHLDELGEPPPDVAALLYRAAQEGLRNAVTHSGAEQIDLTATVDGGTWLLVVDDDGRGLTADDLERRRGNGHFGLRALGDLVADAGGTLAVRSSPAAGTRLEVRVPVR
jgi:two-component system, NarL family, sensor kinase